MYIVYDIVYVFHVPTNENANSHKEAVNEDVILFDVFVLRWAVMLWLWGSDTHKSDFGCTFRLGQINKGEFFKTVHTCFIPHGKIRLLSVTLFMLYVFKVHVVYIYIADS